MGVPSKEVFEVYLDHVWVMPSDLLEEVKALRTPEEKQIFSICERLDESLSIHLERQSKSPVRIWLEGQANYKKAMKKLKLESNRHDQSSDVEYFKARAAAIKKLFDQTFWDKSGITKPTDADARKLKAYEDLNKFMAERNAEKSLKHFLNYYSPSSNYLLHFDVVKCLYDYFYTDRAAALFALNKTGNKLLNQTRSNLKKLSELATYDELAFRPGINNGSIGGRTYTSFVSLIQDVEFKLPFKRNDTTLRERVLTFDLHRAIKKYFKPSKTDAIYNLLMLEGIVNNIEKRNIEKKLSEWNRH